MTTINVFVIHYTKLTKRESTFSKIQNLFSNIVKDNDIKLDMKIISKFDPEKLDNEFVKRIFDSEELKNDKVSYYNKYIIKSPQINFISNCLKHMDALNSISKNSKDDDINIIVEDDVVFDNTMELKIMDFINNKKYMKTPTVVYDIIFFGLPGQPDEANKTCKDLQIIEIEDIKVLPCCDSYFISKRCATALAKDYIPIKFPNNIQLSYLITKNAFNVAKTFPNIMADGSKIGVIPSSISPNNILLFNSSYKEVYKMLDKETPTFEDIAKIEHIFKTNDLKHSADFIFLEGLFYLRTKRYSEAKIQFDKAILIYEDNLSPLSNQSAIIQNYIDLCRHIQ
tara:strand:+ start:298 stop:1317 length:1020 start_codon:yes stop_codon:yes gene_type:complete